MLFRSKNGLCGLAGPWEEHDLILRRKRLQPSYGDHYTAASVNLHGWLAENAYGRNTGPKGQKSADKALLSMGYALLEPDGSVRVPT